MTTSAVPTVATVAVVTPHIRSAYRKIGLTTPPQVVSWCVRHGFPPPHD